MKKACFEIFEVKALGKIRKKEYRFRLQAPNGKIILQSEGYHNKMDALDTVNTIIKYCKDPFTRIVYDVKEKEEK